ncbi:MAG: hypothetical protein MJZ53_04675 [Paludibacteraceae bacterium]|nr:hypothetical protein [Paludibacteraceae bacterium]
MHILSILLSVFFTINVQGDKVEFAPANLVYEDGAYSWAEHDYDFGSYFTFDNAIAAESATQLDGKSWRLLTLYEMQYLLTNYTPTWVTNYEGQDVNGFRLTGEGGSVFFPAAGYVGFYNKSASTGTEGTHEVGTNGNYWTSTAQNESPNINSMCLDVSSANAEISSYYRANQFSVRLGHVTAATTITVDENQDNQTLLTDYLNQTVNVQLVRSFRAGVWNTICLPFDVSEAEVLATFGSGCQLAEFTNAQLNDAKDELTLNMTTVTHIEAGKAYILTPEFNVTNPTFDYKEIELATASGEVDATGDAITFNGIINPHHLPDGQQQYLFVIGTEQLQWSKEGDTSSMKGMRAYFYVPELIAELVAKSSPRMCIGRGAGITTDVQSALATFETLPHKILLNGQIVIEYNGQRYNVLGTILE